MKKLLLLSVAILFIEIGFSQSNPSAPVSTGLKNAARGTNHTPKDNNSATDGAQWKAATHTFTNPQIELGIDSSIFNMGSLQAVLTSDKPTQFKFNRDKFEVVSLQDLKLDYSVKRNFQAGHATFTLYLYSGKLMVFKKEYSVLFDGNLKPTFTKQ